MKLGERKTSVVYFNNEKQLDSNYLEIYWIICCRERPLCIDSYFLCVVCFFGWWHKTWNSVWIYHLLIFIFGWEDRQFFKVIFLCVSVTSGMHGEIWLSFCFFLITQVSCQVLSKQLNQKSKKIVSFLFHFNWETESSITVVLKTV